MFAPRLVDGAEHPPFRCLLSGLTEGQFVDAGVTISSIPFQEPRAQFHPTAVHQLGEAIGMVSEGEHAKALARIEELEDRIAQLREELTEADRQIEAVDALVKKGMVVRKQPGRKPQKKETANA